MPLVLVFLLEICSIFSILMRTEYVYLSDSVFFDDSIFYKFSFDLS